MRSHNLVLAAFAVMTDLGAVAAPVSARGINDAGNNPSLQIISNKIPSNFRFEASALVLPSSSDAKEQDTGIQITQTGSGADATVLRTQDVVPLTGGGQRNTTLTRPALAGAGGQANPLAAGAGGSRGRVELAQPRRKRASAGGPLAGVQDLPAKAMKMTNAPVPPTAVTAPASAVQAAAAALPVGPSPAGAVAATKDVQEMPAVAMAAAGGMIPAAAPPPQKRDETVAVLPGVAVDETTMQTNGFILPLLANPASKLRKRRDGTTVDLPAVHMYSAKLNPDALGVKVFQRGQPERRDRENTAEGCRRHAAEFAASGRPNNNNNEGENGPDVVELRPVAQVEPVASIRPAANIRLPKGTAADLGLARTLGLQERRQLSVGLPRPDRSIRPIVVAPEVQPTVGLQRR